MENNKWQTLRTLALVPCHAVWSLTGDPTVDDSWFLKQFQRGEPTLYIEHIRRAIEFAKGDPTALLVFSGGQTDVAAGPISEAQGYWLIAERLGLWEKDVKSRSTTDEYAVDSFQNLLFSICRFYECVNAYPRRVKLFGWKFKESRFLDFHRNAIRFPSHCFEYIGLNDPLNLAVARQGENKNIAEWSADPYGTGKKLSTKRKERNPCNRQHPYITSCPEMAALLQYRGRVHFSGTLPWDKQNARR